MFGGFGVIFFFKLTSLKRTAMQERAHKLSVRKTVRQIQAALLHPWFKPPCQQGTEPNRASCIPSPPLGHELCTAELSSRRSADALQPGFLAPGWGRPGNPPVPCNIGDFYIWLPLEGTPEWKLRWEQWPDCEAMGRSGLSYLLSDLMAGCIAAFSRTVASTLAQRTASRHSSNARLGCGS